MSKWDRVSIIYNLQNLLNQNQATLIYIYIWRNKFLPLFKHQAMSVEERFVYFLTRKSQW
jgi:hypothetical protein